MTLKKCPSCGHQHDSADIICPYCKHSYSDKKIVCDNCGAYLQPVDRVCYVCGQVVEPVAAPTAVPPVTEEKDEPVFEEAIEEIEAFSQATEDTYEDVQQENQEEPPKKSSSKKVALICGIIVAVVALVSAGICICHFNGWFKPQATANEKVKIYFEKPLSNQNLMTSDGTVYNWTGDVDINYTLDGKAYKKLCKMTEEYDNIWYKKIPAGATDVYFSETSLETVRTEVVGEVVDGNIYFVTDILFNNEMQLPVDSCAFDDFEGLGINYTTAETKSETQKKTKAENRAETEEETDAQVTEEETTEDDAPETEAYSISVPQQWDDAYTIIENGNCTNYYETYNYSNYQCGNLLSVYVFDANDTSYSEMNVQKVITSSDSTKKIVVVTPTDIQFNDGDDTAIEKYTNLSQYTSQVVESITAN